MEKQEQQDIENTSKQIETNTEDAKVLQTSYAEEINKLQDKVDQLQDKLLRQLAETENIRTRSAKIIEEAKDYANFSFARDLVPVMDNLVRALEHLPNDLSQELANVIEGVKMTRSELSVVFNKHHLEIIQPHPGDKFDYHSHHAISQVMTDDYDPGNIVTTMQVGYRIKDRLIRPAAVSVAKKPESKNDAKKDG
jgi:molecular chaperone GrpE